MKEKKDSSVVLVDLDETFLYRRESLLQKFFEKVLSIFLGNARVSAITLFEDIFTSGEPEFYVNKDIVNFLNEQEFDIEFIVTGRMYTEFGTNTRRLDQKYCSRFEEVIMYPGLNVYGERFIRRKSSFIRYFLGSDMVGYKEDVAELFSSFERVVFVDNSYEVVERMEKNDAVDETYLVDEKGVHRFD